MARSLQIATRPSWVFGFGGALFLGASFLLVAAETTGIGHKGCRRPQNRQRANRRPSSKSKAWKSARRLRVQGRRPKHRPRPFVDLKNSAAVAAAVDKMILENLSETGTTPAAKTSDEDFLRRVHFDLAGTVPLPREVTLFGLDPDPDKRIKLIDRLLAGDEYSHNWAGYWRDVIFLRATDMKARMAEGAFEKWMSDQIRDNRGLGQDHHRAAHGDGRGRRSRRDGPDLRARRPGRRDCGRGVADFSGHPDSVRQLPRPSERQVEAAAIPSTGRLLPPRAGQAGREDQAPHLFDRLLSRKSRTAAGKGKGKGKGGGFLEHPERLFMRFDRNRDGKITRNEVKGTPFEKQFDRLLALADANKDGALSRSRKSRKRPLPAARNGRPPSTICPI